MNLKYQILAHMRGIIPLFSVSGLGWKNSKDKNQERLYGCVSFQLQKTSRLKMSHNSRKKNYFHLNEKFAYPIWDSFV